MGDTTLLQSYIEQYLHDIVDTYQNWWTSYIAPNSSLKLELIERSRKSTYTPFAARSLPPEKYLDTASLSKKGLLQRASVPERAPILDHLTLMLRGAILGGPGTGKSTTLRWIALYYARITLGVEVAETDDPHASKIPILVSLSSYAGGNLFEYIKSFLDTHHQDYVFSQAVSEKLDDLLKTGRCIVLLDGLNEVPDEFRSTIFSEVRQFASLYNFSNGNSQINSFFIACREAEYVQSFTDLPRLLLEPLNDGQINEFFHIYYPNDPVAIKRFNERLDRNQGQLRDLVRNPFYLNLLSTTPNDRLDLPKTQGELFQESVQSHIQRGLRRINDLQLIKQLLPEHRLNITSVEILPADLWLKATSRLSDKVNAMLSQIAFSMLIEPSQGTEIKLNTIFSQFPEQTTITFQYRRELKLLFSQFEIETTALVRLCQKGGVLLISENIIDPNRDLLRFNHQLMQEFFAAQYLNRAEKTHEEWKQAALSYDFDEVFPILTDLAVHPNSLITSLIPIDLVLACRCFSMLSIDKKDSQLLEQLLEKVLNLFAAQNSTFDWLQGVRGLAYLRAVEQLTTIALQSRLEEVQISAIKALGEINAFASAPRIISLLQSPDVYVRRNTCDILGKLKMIGAVPYLVSQVADQYSGESALNALAEIGSPEAIFLVVERLPHVDIAIRKRYATVLDRVGRQQGIDLLVDRLTQKDSQVKESAVYVLGLMKAKEVVSHILERLQDDDPVRLSAVIALGQLQLPETIQDLIRMLHDPVPMIRVRAIEALAGLRASEAIQPLITLLSDQSPIVRYSTAANLGQLEATEAVPHLILLLDDENNDVRRISASTLAQLAPQQAVSYILRQLSDVDSDVRHNAVTILNTLDRQQGIQALLPMLENDDSNVRYFAVSGLKALQAKEEVSLLSQVLQDNDFRVVQLTISSLRDFGLGRLAIPKLIEWLRGDDASLREWAISALRDLGSKDEITTLFIERLTDPVAAVRRNAIHALGEWRARAAIPGLIERLDDEDANVRSFAIIALKDLEAKEAIPSLVQRLLDPNTNTRDWAFAALAQIEDAKAVDLLEPLLKHPDMILRGRIHALREDLKRKLRLPKDY